MPKLLRMFLFAAPLFLIVALGSVAETKPLALGDADAPPGSARMTADLRTRLRVRAAQGRGLGQETSVVVRFHDAPSAAQIAALEGKGVRFRRLAGRRTHLRTFFGATASPAGLAALGADPAVRRILPPAPRGVKPLPPPEGTYDHIHTLTTARDTWPTRDAEGRRLTGAGVVIADIDDGVDVFHPLFFHGDGGLFPWLDVNGDRMFQPGVDAVDIDGDGIAGAGETLRMIDTGFADLYSGEVAGQDGVFTAGLDWLYADTDGSHTRDFGPAAGYTDDDPSFGEPYYVVDDVDGSGTLDPGEKLIALGTSKVRGIYQMGSGAIYERGVGLVDYPAIDADSHGSGVSGILVGGVLDRTAIQGVAPDAELVMIAWDATPYSEVTEEPDMNGDMATAVAWARGLGAQILVHEYGTQIGEFADGSSDWEAMLDELSADGMPQLTATHNFAGYSGQSESVVPPGETASVGMYVHDLAMYGMSVDVVYATLRWRGPEDAITATLRAPEGTDFLLQVETYQEPYYLIAERDYSGRGTVQFVVFLAALTAGGAYAPLDPGEWTLLLENTSDEAVSCHFAVSDQTGYAFGLDLTADVTDRGTIAHPSTADSAVSVGASVGNVFYAEYGETQHGPKFFSGRGPRIDGELGVDVLAPEDHFTAWPGGDGWAQGQYAQFGGTSGALPQVGGAVALLLQAEPELDPAQIRERLRERATADEWTGDVPNETWGYGRIAAYRLIHGTEPPANAPPTARIDAPAVGAPGNELVLDASASSDPDGDAASLIYRWDTDYDGVWDVEALGEPTTALILTQEGRAWVKLEVEDALGWTHQVLTSIWVGAAPVEPVAEPGADVVEPGADVVEPGLDVPEPDPDATTPPVDATALPDTGSSPDAAVVVPPDDTAGAGTDTPGSVDTGASGGGGGSSSGCAGGGGSPSGPAGLLVLLALFLLPATRRVARGRV